MESFKGPLGSHNNYINHIALENYHDYRQLCELNKDNGKNNIPDKYKECRYFLNAIESINNILDYLYFEHENEIKQPSIIKYRGAACTKHPELEALANLANAYKHCIRERRNVKNSNLPWAKDLQKPQLMIGIRKTSRDYLGLSIDYLFNWPIPEHELILKNAAEFWIDYVQPNECDLKNI